MNDLCLFLVENVDLTTLVFLLVCSLSLLVFFPILVSFSDFYVFSALTLRALLSSALLSSHRDVLVHPFLNTYYKDNCRNNFLPFYMFVDMHMCYFG